MAVRSTDSPDLKASATFWKSKSICSATDSRASTQFVDLNDISQSAFR